MIAPLAPAWLIGLAGLLIAWRIRARFRRLVGRQRLSQYRGPVSVVIFSGLLIAIARPSMAQPSHLLVLGAALLAGAALGVFGLRSTRFEAIAGEGLFYTPNARLGLALFAVFAARLVYRLVEIATATPESARASAPFLQSPLTLATFALLAAYSITYAIGLMRWRTRVLRAKRAREARQAVAQG